MKKRLLSLTLIGITGVFALASCSNANRNTESTSIVESNTTKNNGSTITHAFSDALSYDDTNHYHECNVDGCNLVHDIEAHSFNTDGVCEVCGFKKETAKPVDANEIKEIQIFDYIQTSGRETRVLQRLFNVGDTFNTTNLALKVVKTKNRVDTTEILSLNDVEITTPDMQTEGVKDVKIKYGEKEISYTITVLNLNNVDKEKAVVNVDSAATPSVSGNVITVNRINDAVVVFKVLKTSSNASKQINVKEGMYHEKVEFDIPNIRLKGESTDASKTIIEYDLLAEYRTPGSLTAKYSTDGSASVSIRKTADGFYAENITFQNYFNTNKRFNESKNIVASLNGKDTQAVACLVQADKVVFENVRFSGYHDTLYSQVGRHIYHKCYIEGRTDYIFGMNATSYFDECDIVTIGANDTKNGGYLVATMGSDNNGTEASKIEYGYIFNKCNISADSATVDGTVALARGWNDNMHLAFINSNISSAYSKTAYETKIDNKNERYLKMNAAPNSKFLFEYGNTGAGALDITTPGEIDKLCTILSEEEAKNFTDYSKIFAAKNGNYSYSSAWDGSIGTLVPVSYNFEEFAERANLPSEENGDSLFNGDITIKGTYRIESSKYLMQVQPGTVIEFNKVGTVTVEWFGGDYGTASNGEISYKDGKATIKFKEYDGKKNIYFYGFKLDGSNPGVHEHQFGDFEITAPTLESKGSATRTCIDCELETPFAESVELPELTDSRYEIKNYTQAATTTEKGKAIYSITIDNQTFEFEGETPVLEAGEHNHVFGDWNITKPTFENKGSAERICSANNCNLTDSKEEVELPVLSSDLYTITNNTATIDSTGTGTYTITIDGKVISFEAGTPRKELKQVEATYSYSYSSNGNNSDDYINLSNCKDNSPYLKLVSGSMIKLNVKKNSEIVIGGFYIGGSWGGIKINGVNQEVPANNGSVTYVAAEDGIITIELIDQSGITQSAIKTITVSMPIAYNVIEDEFEYVYTIGSRSQGTLEESTENIKFDGCTVLNANYLYFTGNNTIKFKVIEGAKVTISGMYISDVDGWGSVNINGTDYSATNNSVEYTATEDEEIIIKAQSGKKGTLGKITVTYA